MNSRWKENPIVLQFLLGLLLFVFLSTLSYLIGLMQPSLSRLALFARANSTRTAIALTSQALYGPFPTATGPTPTASWTPSLTPTPTVTPTNTPTPTRVRYFINTSTPRTLVPQTGQTSTGAPPTEPPRATNTSAPPIQPPRPTSTSVQATNPPPQATDRPPQPTNPPRRATKTDKPPKPTKTPKKNIIAAECLYTEGCYDFLVDYAARLAYEYPEPQRFARVGDQAGR